jgi:uncharacterized protein
VLISHLLIYIFSGCAAGYLAGLFGVGGGIVIVPVLTTLFQAMGVDRAVIMPLAIGTSMAVVLITSLLSARTHHTNGNVDWATAKMLIPTVSVGVVSGALLGAYISRAVLVWCVIAFELGVATMFLTQVWNQQGHAEGYSRPQKWPPILMQVVAMPLGLVSSIVGIAGGTLFVPFLTICGIDMRRAIGSAAALGVPISIVATVVYIATGIMGHKVLPPFSIGYVYLPAFFGCVVGSLEFRLSESAEKRPDRV